MKRYEVIIKWADGDRQWCIVWSDNPCNALMSAFDLVGNQEGIKEVIVTLIGE